MGKIVLSGATGLIGSALLQTMRDQNNCEVIALGRQDFENSKRLEASLRDAQAVIHLAGEAIAGRRWTPRQKQKLYDSRIQTTRLIVQALRNLEPPHRPKILINASAVGYYGDRGEEILTEESDAGSDFLARLVSDWEAEALVAKTFGVRVVLLRTGLVLGVGGGALSKMQPGVLGSGRQWMSWIHLDDEVRFIEFALANEQINGVYNLVSPNPMRNREFMKELKVARRFPVLLRAPAFLLRATLGEMSTLLLSSQRVLPHRAQQAGFLFTHGNLAEALQSIYQK